MNRTKNKLMPRRPNIKDELGLDFGQSLSYASMRRKLTSNRTSNSIKRKLHNTMGSRSWKKQDGGIVEYKFGGLSWGDGLSGGQLGGISAIGGMAGGAISGLGGQNKPGMQALGGAASGAAAGMALGPIGALAGGLIGGIGGLIKGKQAKQQSEEEEAALMEQMQGKAREMQELGNQVGSNNLATFPGGGTVGQPKPTELPGVTKKANVKFVDSPDDPAYKAYQDSLNWHKEDKKYYDEYVDDIRDKELRSSIPNYNDLPKYKNNIKYLRDDFYIDYNDDGLYVGETLGDGPGKYGNKYAGTSSSSYSPEPKQPVFVKSPLTSNYKDKIDSYIKKEVYPESKKETDVKKTNTIRNNSHIRNIEKKDNIADAREQYSKLEVPKEQEVNLKPGSVYSPTTVSGWQYYSGQDKWVNMKNSKEILTPDEFEKRNPNAALQSNYRTLYPMGGLIPYDQPNAELEKEEVTAAPDGSMAKFDLPTHGNATAENQMALEPGTRVFSDRLKATTGKTFAEEADKIRKEIMKYEQILYT